MISQAFYLIFAWRWDDDNPRRWRLLKCGAPDSLGGLARRFADDGELTYFAQHHTTGNGMHAVAVETWNARLELMRRGRQKRMRNRLLLDAMSMVDWCHVCNGRGEVKVLLRQASGFNDYRDTPGLIRCRRCRGTGRTTPVTPPYLRLLAEMTP